MKEENKHCYNCRFYRKLYSKGYNCFSKSKWGMCQYKQVREMHEVCEKWNYNNEFNRSVEKELSLSASMSVINDIQKNLTEIGQILKELNDTEC